MGELFLHLVNTGITASWIVLVIIGLRILLKKVPKWIYCLLWAIVGLRLLLPFSVESSVSLVPSMETINPDLFFGRIVVQSGVPALDAPINNYLGTHYYESITVPIGFFDACMDVLSRVWFVGIVVLLLYSVFSYMQLYRKTAVSMLYKENIYFCDHIDTPFVLGIFRPRICLPSDLDETQMKAVIRHEQAHLQRKDHWWKPLAFLLLIVYWFNPVLWLAFWLFSRDLELACDEKAIREMNVESRKSYSRVLLDCSTRRRKRMVCPIAFGEVGVKRRIRSVLFYKRSGKVSTVFTLILFALLSIGFLTDPIDNTRMYDVPTVMLTHEAMHYRSGEYSQGEDDKVSCYTQFDEQSMIYVDSCPFSSDSHWHKTGVWYQMTACEDCGTVINQDKIQDGVYCSSKNIVFSETNLIPSVSNY